MYYSLALGRPFCSSFTRVMIHFFFFSHFLLMVLLPERGELFKACFYSIIDSRFSLYCAT